MTLSPPFSAVSRGTVSRGIRGEPGGSRKIKCHIYGHSNITYSEVSLCSACPRFVWFSGIRVSFAVWSNRMRGKKELIPILSWKLALEIWTPVPKFHGKFYAVPNCISLQDRSTLAKHFPTNSTAKGGVEVKKSSGPPMADFLFFGLGSPHPMPGSWICACNADSPVKCRFPLKFNTRSQTVQGIHNLSLKAAEIYAVLICISRLQVQEGFCGPQTTNFLFSPFFWFLFFFFFFCHPFKELFFVGVKAAQDGNSVCASNRHNCNPPGAKHTKLIFAFPCCWDRTLRKKLQKMAGHVFSFRQNVSLSVKVLSCVHITKSDPWSPTSGIRTACFSAAFLCVIAPGVAGLTPPRTHSLPAS